jgi:uncharacterized protein (TIGR00369 family)
MPIPRRVGFVETMGIHESAGPPGEHRAELLVTEAHQNIQGVTHGSVTIGLLDTAMGHALTGVLKPDEFCSTTQFSTQFLRASRPGDRLKAVGRVLRRGRHVAYLEGTCVNDRGEDVARAHGTWYVGTISRSAE